ncbi:SDR family oxidoreductase [Acerihabitans sp. TG2]|uniref:SDR family oxidoreductase n=1 Tax=Acerihabitans sp. TG2 TaxID=3096008 RepID=UPI002B231669|nr:SDR family oxidoreductase [Acerihabitans sp. TG2]MEA9393268.1 SDR family oxidoreductase [Acerihabitans sp. TG2]
MKLKGKRILLTGASGGIGRALSMELANHEASLFLHGRDVKVLDSIRRTLPYPERHQIIDGDLGSVKDRVLLQSVIARNGGIDILINNAGTCRFAWLKDQSEDHIAEQLSLNIQVPVLLSRAMLPYLNNPGIIMNIGSSFGGIGYPGYSIYCASKFALRGFSEALGRELASTGINVLYFAPRATRTPLNTASVNALNSALGNRVDSAEWVAQQAVLALSKEHKRLWLGWPEKIFVKINALFPHVVDNAIAKKLNVIEQHSHDLPDNEHSS